MIGLLAAHRPAIDEGDTLDAELLGQQTVLDSYVVSHRHTREASAIVRWTDIAWRGGQAIAEHVWDDDEVPLQVERAARADQPFRVVVLGAVGSRIHDRIAARRIKSAVRRVGELRIPQGESGLERYVAELEYLVIA